MKEESEEREHDEAAEDTSTNADSAVDPILSGPLLRGTPTREHSPPPRPKRTQSELPEPISLSPSHPVHHEETHPDDEDYDEVPEPALSVRDPLPSFPFDPPPSSAAPQLALTPLGPLPPPTPPPKRDRPVDPRSPRPARRQAARTRGNLPNAVKRSVPPPKEPTDDDEESRVKEAIDADISRSEKARDGEGHRSGPLAWLLLSAIVGIGGFELGLSKGRSEIASKRIVEAPAEAVPHAAPTVQPTADVTSETPQEAPSAPTAETAVPTEAPSTSAAPTSSAVVADAPTATATALAPAPSTALTGALPTSAPAAPSTATAVATASAAPASPSGGVDRTALASALARSAGAVGGCPSDTDGSLTVTVTFLPSGSVGSTSSSGSLAGTQTAACVERLFGVAHVPPFEGDPVTTSTTVSLKAH